MIRSVSSVAVARARSYATAAAATATAGRVDLSKFAIPTSESGLDKPVYNWHELPQEAKSEVQRQITEMNKADWKTISKEQKKAFYTLAYGEHTLRGRRTQPGDGVKVAAGVAISIAVAAGVFGFARVKARDPPRTMTPEWQEATNQIMLEKNANPIHGIASEGYNGAGMVNTK
ncbi:cytochrome c oxidase subunit IV [Ramicandelaber brevisporus]|nr:cytochrome c oxidase subunit IV [Ramicandelaber brevisporus]